MPDLTDRVALVTGASRGLGAAIARKLAACGAKVAVNYHASRELAEQLCQSIGEAGGVAEPFGADVSDEAATKRLVADVRQRFGPLDIVVLNATAPQPFLTIEEQTWEACLDQLRFFVKSPLLIVQQVLAEMKQRRSGRIIQIGSEVVALGHVEFAHYVGAKGAQHAMSRSWARELGPYGITVNVVAPGWIPTERHTDVDQADRDAYAANVALRRQGVPDDVGEAVAFLASDAARFITGQKISVNGGNTLE